MFKIKKAIISGLMIGALLGMPIQAQKKNPVDNKFFLIDYINGIEYRLSDELNQAFKVGKTFELGRLGKFYFQGLSPNEITLNYFKSNYSLEAILDKGLKLNFEIRQDDFTLGVKSSKSVSLTYLNTKGIKIREGLLFHPYLRTDIGKNEKSLLIGSIFVINKKIAPYLIMVNNGEKNYGLGIEYHTTKNMIALRSEISKDKKEVRVELGYKF